MTPEQERLIFDHLRLPTFFAHRYRGGQSDEVLDEARLALVEAAVSFDPARGIKFRTHAMNRMRWAVADYFRRIDTMTRTERRAFKAGKYPIVYAVKGHSAKEPKTVHIDPVAFRKGLMMAGCP